MTCRKYSCLVLQIILAGWSCVATGQQPPSAPRRGASPLAIPKPNMIPHAAVPTPETMASTALKNFDRFAKRRTPGQLSSANPNDHEDAGILNDGGGTFTGVFAVHSIYSPAEFQLQLPTGATAVQTLFAPTTRATNGACLEVGTAYTTAPSSGNTQVEVYAFDFCMPGGPNWGVHIPVNQQFIDKYAGATAVGRPAYALAIFTTDAKVASNSVWHAQLFNFQTQTWDEIYSRQGSYQDWDPRGWSIFETWYQPGQCSAALPQLGVEGLAYYEPIGKQWLKLAETLSPVNAAPLHNYVHLGGSCFVDDATGPASYRLLPKQPAFDSWSVSSSGH